MARIRIETNRSSVKGSMNCSEVVFNISEELAQMMAKELTGKNIAHTRHALRHYANVTIVNDEDKVIGGIYKI